jgi:hypothetical protein
VSVVCDGASEARFGLGGGVLLRWAGGFLEILLGKAVEAPDLEGGGLEGTGVADRTATASTVAEPATSVAVDTSGVKTGSGFCNGVASVGSGVAPFNSWAAGREGVSLRLVPADDCSPAGVGDIDGGTVDLMGGGGGVTRRNVGRTWGGGLVGGGTEG